MIKPGLQKLQHSLGKDKRNNVVGGKESKLETKLDQIIAQEIPSIHRQLVIILRLFYKTLTPA